MSTARPTLVAIVVFLVCATSSSAAPAQESPEFFDAMDQAEVLMLEEDFKSALKALREADRMANGQSFDCQLRMARAFDVRTFPTYVLIDPSGKIVFRRSGWSRRVAAELSREVGRHLRAARKNQR